MAKTKKDDLPVLVEPVLQKVGALEIRSRDDYTPCAELLKAVKQTSKLVTEAFAPEKKKAQDRLNAIRAEEKKWQDPLATAEKQLKKKMSDFEAAEAKRIREEQARLEEERRKQAEENGGELFPEPPAPPPEPAAPKTEGVHTVTEWHFEVTDPQAVPREYLVVDEKKIGQVVRAMKGDTDIPGVKVWSTQGVRVRT